MNERDRVAALLDELELSNTALRCDASAERRLLEDFAPGALSAGLDPAVEQVARHAEVAPDPFFAHRVLRSLPPPMPFAGITPARRLLLLGSFYGAAFAAAYWVVTEVSSASTAALIRSADDVSALGGEATAEWGAALMIALVAAVGLVAFVVTRAHTRTT